MPEKDPYKEAVNMYQAYILGIPYNGKIITWEDFEKVRLILIAQKGNEKDWE